MNRYLLLSAAAVLSSVTAASAYEEKKSHSGMQAVYVTSSSTSFCNAIDLQWQGVIYDQRDGGCVSGEGQGMQAKTKGIGNNVDVSDDYLQIAFRSNIAVSFDFQTPIKDGSKFGAWASFSGVTSFEFVSGKYRVGAPPPSGPSIQSLLGALLRKNKA